MAQVKKEAVREAILAAAFRLFRDRGYAATTISMIAGAAGFSTANVYVYFPSKFRIAFTLYDAWFRARVAALRAEVAMLEAPRAKLAAILHALWCEIPRAEGGFANCFMEAISTLGPEDSYEPTLLRWAEGEIAAMLEGCVRDDALRVARIALMAFDGFAIGHKLQPGAPCDEATIAAMVGLLLPASA